ncbi:multiple epidermal growth factor-like domains protein 10 [Mytilus trossulus]|uniref:multiple epidermal growth factor-like domains protein 10 n=1 Tax=Mytilus trossulus TaxID=6551 RepID=UPI0030079776
MDIFAECTDCTNIVCPKGFCGEGCLNICECTSHAHCHHQQCCVCNKGFTGQSCDTPCVEGYFGEGCIHTCLCSNHSTCDRFTGTCLCDDGWTGDTCAEATYLNITCAPNCNCLDARCSNNGSHLSNPTTTDSQLSSDADASQQKMEKDNFILFLFIVLCLMIAFILVVIFISTKCKKKYCAVEAKSRDTTCHVYELSW